MNDLMRSAALTVAERYVVSIRKREWENLGSTLSDGFSREDRRSGLMSYLVGRESHVAGWKALADQGITDLNVGPLATRGDHLCLYGGHIATPDGFEIGALELFETDEDDLVNHVIFFEENADDEAFAELDARYIAGEAAPFAATISDTGSFVDAYNSRDWDALRRIASPDFVLNDHRPASLGRIEGFDNLLSSTQPLVDLVPDLRMRLVETRAGARAALARMRFVGTSTEGASMEMEFYAIACVDAGRVASLEYFPLEQRDAARSRFDELVSGR